MFFDQTDLYDLPPPEHLRRLPEEVAARLASMIRAEFAGAMPYTLAAELQAFIDTRSRWDAQRVARALRHVYGRAGLAQEVDDALSTG